MTKQPPKKAPVLMSFGKDYNSPLRVYEWVLFDEDESVVERKSGYRSTAAAKKAGARRAAELLDALAA